MSDLAAFYAARLDEAEARAGYIHDVERDQQPLGGTGRCVCGYPDRVLRQVAAGRAILAEHANALKTWKAAKAAQDNDRRVAAAHVLLVWEHVLKIRAAVYSDHPGYDPAWA